MVEAGDGALELVVQGMLDLLRINGVPHPPFQPLPVQLQRQPQDQQPQLLNVVHHNAELGGKGKSP